MNIEREKELIREEISYYKAMLKRSESAPYHTDESEQIIQRNIEITKADIKRLEEELEFIK